MAADWVTVNETPSVDSELGGWTPVQADSVQALDIHRSYRIRIGREHWHLRSNADGEWFCSRAAGDPQIPANALVEAGCPVFAKRQPLRWEGIARVVRYGGRLVLEDTIGPDLPERLNDTFATVILMETTDEPETDA